MRHTITIRSILHSLRAVAALGLIFLLVSACGGVRHKPVLLHETAASSATVKRLARYMEVDNYHRWSATAYKKRVEPVKRAKGDMAEVLDVNGQPDYIRVPFESHLGEWTEEWIYMDQNKLYQFIGGKMVHTQPVSDVERTLITYGYPSYCMNSKMSDNIQRINFIYRNSSGEEVRVFSFTDGKQVSQSK